MQTILMLTQTEFGAAAHYRQTMIDIHPQKIKQPQGLRLPIHQRHIINAEGILQRRVLI